MELFLLVIVNIPSIKLSLGSKIFKINEFIALGAAGYADQMRSLVDELKKRTGNNIFEDSELRTTIEDTLLDLHKRYNVRWSNHLEKPTLVFNLYCLVAAKLKDDTFQLYYLRFYPEPWVEHVDVYETIGSGDMFASLLLKLHSRIPAIDNKTFADLELGYNIWIASYAINEIKEFDTRLDNLSCHL
jgi:hypothetical protein